MEVDGWMNLDELQKLYESVWDEKNGNGSVNGEKERKEKKRKKWAMIKQPTMPRGTVMYENHIFRIEQRGAFRYITPKYQYVRVNEKGRKSVQRIFELAEMTYDEFFERYLSYDFSKTVANGRVSGLQKKFLMAIAQEGILPMTGDMNMIRRC